MKRFYLGYFASVESSKRRIFLILSSHALYRNGLKSVDGWLLAPACVYLASKAEEFGVIPNARLISVTMTTGLWSSIADHSSVAAIGLITIYVQYFTTWIASNKCPELFPRPSDYPYKMPQVLECEFYLLEMMVWLISSRLWVWLMSNLPVWVVFYLISMNKQWFSLYAYNVLDIKKWQSTSFRNFVSIFN